LPQFFVQSVRTVVRVNDGDTVVMGGLMRDNLIRTDDKTPILGDLPLIGRFWRGTSEVARKSNLMIFVNAKLIDPSGKARRRATAVR
jgi:general secretion pathway protein D